MKVALPIVNSRRERMSRLLQAHGYLPVAELCQRLDISEATARRDLASLTKKGEITRTHGGALGEFNEKFPAFNVRQKRAQRGKERIAEIAVAQIREGATCFLDAGTTMLALAEKLANSDFRSLKVVTNNVPVAEMLSAAEGIDAFLLGGQFFSKQAVLLGSKTIESLKAWRFDMAFLGAEGMTPEGIWNSQRDIVALQRAVLHRTKTTCFCVDASKLGHTTEHLLAGWDEVSCFITDADAGRLKEHGIPVRKGALLK